MEALKNALAVLGAIVGALTAILTLYAKYLDVKKGATKDGEAAVVDLKPATQPPETRVRPGPMGRPHRICPLATISGLIGGRSPSIGLGRSVKAPAITMIVAGLICLCSNLTGCRLRIRRPVRHTADRPSRRTSRPSSRRIGRAFLINARPDGLSYMPPDRASDDKASMMVGFFSLLMLSIPSAVAIWGGFEMLRLRSYWVSVVGSLAIMPAGLVCCLGGFPVGIWSLVVLFQPEVKASFH